MTSKRRVDYAIFQKWQCDLDREYQTMSWLDCSCDREGGKKPVNKLRCKVCSEFVDRIRGMKNFSDKWIVGADSIRVSNVREHAQNKQHEHAMSLLRKRSTTSAGLDPLASSASPIVRAFVTLSDEEKEKLRVKFTTSWSSPARANRFGCWSMLSLLVGELELVSWSHWAPANRTIACYYMILRLPPHYPSLRYALLLWRTDDERR